MNMEYNNSRVNIFTNEYKLLEGSKLVQQVADGSER